MTERSEIYALGAMIIVVLLCLPNDLLFFAPTATRSRDEPEPEISYIGTGLPSEHPEHPVKRSGGDDDWPMFCRNNNHSSFSEAKAPVNGSLLWTYDMNDINQAPVADVVSSPVIVGDTVYVCSGNYFMAALNIDTGEKRWHAYLENTIASTPVYHEGSLYVGAGREMWKIDAVNGSKESIFTADNAIFSSPAIFNSTLYFGTMYDDGLVYAIGLDGTPKWNISMNASITGTPGSPAVADGTVFIGSDSGLFYALDHDGLTDGDDGEVIGDNGSADVLWSDDLSAPIWASPTVAGNKVIVSTYNTSGNNRVIAYQKDNGSLQWSRPVSSKIRSTASYDAVRDMIYVGTFGGELLALNATTGDNIWSFETGEAIQSSPALAEDQVFFGAFDKRIYALEAEGNGDGTTTENWNYTTGGLIHSSPAISGGRLFIGNNDDKLYVLGAPDLHVGISEIILDDEHPYVGENITVKINITNRGSVGTAADVVTTAANPNNTVKHQIHRTRTYIDRGETVLHEFDWTVEDNPSGVWNLWLEITNSSLNESNKSDNVATRELKFQRETPGGWRMTGGDGRHWGYNSVGSVSNRTLWSKDLSSPLLPPITYKGRTIVASQDGRVRSYHLDGAGSLDWDIDLASSLRPLGAGYGKIFVPSDSKMTALDVGGFEDGNSGVKTESDVSMGAGDVHWSADLTSPPTAPPTVSDGYLYLAMGANIAAFDEDDGSVAWNVTLSGEIRDGSPALSGDLLYLTTANGDVICLDRYDGSRVWSYRLPDASLGQHLTLVSDLIVCSLPSGVIALDAHDGNLSWTISVASDVTTPPAYSPVTGLIYFGTADGEIFSAAADGSKYYPFNVSTPVASHISLGDESLYFAVSDNTIYSLDLSALRDLYQGKAAKREDVFGWTFVTDGEPTSSIAVDEYVVVTTSDGLVYCIGAPNTRPVAAMSAPDPGSEYFTGDPVAVNASLSRDADGDRILFIWKSDLDGPLYRGYNATTELTLTTAGKHNLSLTADDELGGTSTVWVSIFAYERTPVEREIADPDRDLSVRIKGSVGGVSPTIELRFSENPSEIMGRDAGLFANISLEHVRMVDWINLSVSYSNSTLPYRLNESYLSLYHYQRKEGWVKLESVVDEVGKEIWANMTYFPTVSPSENVTVLSAGTFFNANPALLSANVTPKRGPSDGLFNFTVFYSDGDGDLPEEIVVVIDGEEHAMLPVEDGVYDAETGILYYHSRTGLEPGNHSFHFRAFDGITGVKSEVFANISAFDPRPTVRLSNPRNGSEFQAGEEIIFNASLSEDPENDIKNYTWVIRKKGSSPDERGITFVTIDPIFKHEFSTPGIYNISLTVTDEKGHVSEPYNITVTIVEAPSQGSGVIKWLIVLAVVLVLFLIGIEMFKKERPEEEGAEREDEEITGECATTPVGSLEEEETEATEGGATADAEGAGEEEKVGGLDLLDEEEGNVTGSVEGGEATVEEEGPDTIEGGDLLDEEEGVVAMPSEGGDLLDEEDVTLTPEGGDLLDEEEGDAREVPESEELSVVGETDLVKTPEGGDLSDEEDGVISSEK